MVGTSKTKKIAASVKQTRSDLQLGGGEADENKSHDFRDWAALPKGPLESILRCLHLLDRLSFTKVCKSWRSCLFLNEQGRFPWLMMNDQNCSSIKRGFSIMEDVCYQFKHPEVSGSCIWGSFQDWLILINKQTPLLSGKNDIYLLNPFSRQRLHLPKISNYYHKLVLSSSPCDENCVFMLVGKRPVFRISGAPTWHEFYVHGAGGPYYDAVFFQGCFYLLSIRYNVAVIDVQDVLLAMKAKDTPYRIRTRHLPIKMPDKERCCSFCSAHRYLVQSCHDVLLVCQHFGPKYGSICKTQHINVYKMDVDQEAWVKLESLGDQVLFIGGNCSTSYSSQELGIGMANCVFFTCSSHSPASRMDVVFGHTSSSNIDGWGIFNLDKQGATNFALHTSSNELGPIWLSAPAWWYNTSRQARNLVTNATSKKESV